MTLIPRAAWVARYPNGAGSRSLPATEAWLHNTVTIAPDLIPPFDDDDAAVRLLELIGQQRFGRGISYTRVFTPVGRAYEGHSVDRIGAHTGGHNTKGIGYALVGNYDVDRPSEAMLEAVAQQIVADHRAGYLARPVLDGGHRDTKATACPGRHAYAAIPAINARAAAIMAGSGNDDTEPMEDEDMPHMIRNEKTGDLRVFMGGALRPVRDAAYHVRLRDSWGLRTYNLPAHEFEGILKSHGTV